jgi:hypothetical protein
MILDFEKGEFLGLPPDVRPEHLIVTVNGMRVHHPVYADTELGSVTYWSDYLCPDRFTQEGKVDVFIWFKISGGDDGDREPELLPECPFEGVPLR